MTNSGKIYKSCSCEGCLGYLCDSIQPYKNYIKATPADFLEKILEIHNSMTPENKHIFLGLCDFSGENTHSFNREAGGEIRVRRVEKM